MIQPEAAVRWIEAYAAAWRQRDPERAAQLFAADARYSSDPFGPGLRGRAAIRAYWAEALDGQDDIAFTAGPPLVAGDRAAVEWWVAFRKNGADVTLAATLQLRFDGDGLCTELREYWLRADDRHEAPAGRLDWSSSG